MPRRITQSRTRRAFTLIELLLVLVILAVLAAVVIPKMTGRVEESRRKATLAGISNLKSAMEQFEVDNGRYPSTNEGIGALMQMPAGLDQTWHASLTEVPVDGWGHPFEYIGPDQAGEGLYNIISLGPDGQEATGDELDIYSK